MKEMKQLPRLAAACLLAIVLGTASVSAQQTGTDPGQGAGSTGNGAMGTASRGDHDNNWGWVGLLGLAGLAGLMRRRDVRDERTSHNTQLGSTPR